MPERQLTRMQEHSLQPFACELPIPREITVFVVPGQRVTEMREMHADLMGPPGLQFRLE